MMYLLLFIGFIFLIKGADYFVEGSSSIAKLLKIPSVIIGLTIVAMGTSAPEAAVSITAGLAGNSDISLSNIIGSNIFNLLVVVGICALIKPVPTDKDILNRDFLWSIALSILLVVFLFDSKITVIEGLILLVIFVSYLTIVIRSALRNRAMNEASLATMSPFKSILYMIGGLCAIIMGGNLVVNNASKIAEVLGMSQTLIGLTIIAVGTSLPELVTSIVAAKKGESGLALGNVVGSNLFNIMFILGTTTALTPISSTIASLIDAIFLVVVSIIMYLFCRSDKKTSRMEGAISVAIYIMYTIYIIMR